MVERSAEVFGDIVDLPLESSSREAVAPNSILAILAATKPDHWS
jgi:hypothetical protein